MQSTSKRRHIELPPGRRHRNALDFGPLQLPRRRGHGMMPDDDMAALKGTRGADAARLFLEQMIVHHEGEVEIAQTELDQGTNPAVRSLAQTILDARTAEIIRMNDLLTQI
jgi:uncharacterized protein (DUF305 family)